MKMSLNFFVPFIPNGAMRSPLRQCRNTKCGLPSSTAASSMMVDADEGLATVPSFGVMLTDRLMGWVTGWHKSMEYSSGLPSGWSVMISEPR